MVLCLLAAALDLLKTPQSSFSGMVGIEPAECEAHNHVAFRFASKDTADKEGDKGLVKNPEERYF